MRGLVKGTGRWREDWREDEDDRPWIKVKKPPHNNPSFPRFENAEAFEGKLQGTSLETQRTFEGFRFFADNSFSKSDLPSISWDQLSTDLSIAGEAEPSLPIAEFVEYLQTHLKPFLEEIEHLSEARRAYQSVYALYHDHKKQAEELELVLGVGLLTWAPSEGTIISRHLITLPAEINFNAYRGHIGDRTYRGQS